tara:strand:+ start:576 stop:821 length:246 start_codon:yes stop_codon:yes gene_type:complete
MEELPQAIRNFSREVNRLLDQARQIEQVTREKERQMAEEDGLEYTDEEIEERVAIQMKSMDYTGLINAEIEKLNKEFGRYA